MAIISLIKDDKDDISIHGLSVDEMKKWAEFTGEPIDSIASGDEIGHDFDILRFKIGKIQVKMFT